MPDGDETGIDFGDLPDILDQVVRDVAASDAVADEGMPLRRAYDGHCDHKRASINGAMRRLVCRSCGANLDPYEFIFELSQSSESLVHARKEAERRAIAARDRLDELLRKERNARERLRRLNQQLAEDE